MTKENINKFKDFFKMNNLIINYLFDYLKNQIDELIDDYEIEEEYIDEIRIIGYKSYKPNELTVYINFFDECSESGIGLQEYEIKLDDFFKWLENE